MTRRRSLAGRLSRALAACVALALIVMVAASTLVMRSWMLGNMDSELLRLSQRAGEHLDVEDAPDDEVDADGNSDDDDSDDAGAARPAVGWACASPRWADCARWTCCPRRAQGTGVWRFRHRRGHSPVRERGWAGGRRGRLELLGDLLE